MIGNFLKRMEEKSRNPENLVKLREARQEIADKDASISEKNEIIERLQQQNQRTQGADWASTDEEC